MCSHSLRNGYVKTCFLLYTIRKNAYCPVSKVHTKAGDRIENLVCGLAPDEGLRILVVVLEVRQVRIFLMREAAYGAITSGYTYRESALNVFADTVVWQDSL